MRIAVARLVPFVLILILIVPIGVLACSCSPVVGFQHAFEGVDVVFGGLVIALRIVSATTKDPLLIPSVENLIVTFKLEQVWKWPVGKHEQVSGLSELEVTTSYTSGTCGYPFDLGDRYLVYANGKMGAMHTSLCTRTAQLSAAQEDVIALGTPVFLATASPSGEED